jgi:hypothetical protein
LEGAVRLLRAASFDDQLWATPNEIAALPYPQISIRSVTRISQRHE